MGKRKKLAALAAAGVLCMSMGFNVMAAPSVTDPKPEAKVLVGQASDQEGNHYNVNVESISKEVEAVLTDVDQVSQIFEEAGYTVKVGQNIEVYYLGVGDITLENGEVPQGGVEIPFTISKKEVKPGDTIYVMHQKSDGTWEILEGIVGDDNRAIIHFDSLSPIAVVKVLSDGSVVVLDKDKNKLGEVDSESGKFIKTEKKEPTQLEAPGVASKVSKESTTAQEIAKETAKATTKTSISEKKSPKTGE